MNYPPGTTVAPIRHGTAAGYAEVVERLAPSVVTVQTGVDADRQTESLVHSVGCSGLSAPRPRVSATTAPRCPIGSAGPTVLSTAV